MDLGVSVFFSIMRPFTPLLMFSLLPRSPCLGVLFWFVHCFSQVAFRFYHWLLCCSVFLRLAVGCCSCLYTTMLLVVSLVFFFVSFLVASAVPLLILDPQPRLQLQPQLPLQLQLQLQLHYFTPCYSRLHYATFCHTTIQNTTVYYANSTLHYANYTTPQLELQLRPQLHYTNYIPLQLQLHNITLHYSYKYNCPTPHYIQQLWVR